MTNPENADVTCLNDGDIYALFGPESDGIDTWNGADSLAAEVGGNGGFPDAPLEITAPGQESGTYDAFIELTGIEDIAIAQGVPEDDAAALRNDYQPSPNDNVIITAMEGSPSALGFVGFAFAEEAGDQIKEIEVDGGDGCVAPSPETISDGSYPLSRSLYIYVSNDAAARARGRGLRRLLPRRTTRSRPMAWPSRSATSPCRPIGSRRPVPRGSRPRLIDDRSTLVRAGRHDAVRPFSGPERGGVR